MEAINQKFNVWSPVFPDDQNEWRESSDDRCNDVAPELSTIVWFDDLDNKDTVVSDFHSTWHPL